MTRMLVNCARLGVAAVGAVALISLAAVSAQASGYHTWVSNKALSSGGVASSGTISKMDGGKGTLQYFYVQPEVWMESYYPAPGYTTIGYATSTGTVVTLNHPTATNAHQKCGWNWPYSSSPPGTLKITCQYLG